jgi:hypothetical protein
LVHLRDAFGVTQAATIVAAAVRPGTTAWSLAGVALKLGANVITVTARWEHRHRQYHREMTDGTAPIAIAADAARPTRRRALRSRSAARRATRLA